jgi:hypothetical protein
MPNGKRNGKAKQARNGRPARRVRQPKGMSANIFAPAAQARLVTTAKPQISYRKSGACNVRHVEYVADVTGSTNFATTTYAIQPGLVGSFPWLSAIAKRFETYHFRALRAWYLVESATTETGFIVYAVDYDAAEAAPLSKLIAMSYQNSVRGVPWEEFAHTSTAANLTKRPQYYVRTGALAANLDIKSYDVGNLFVCTGGNVGTTGRGELYFEYDIDLFTPQLRPDEVSQDLVGGLVGAGGTLSNGNPLGTAPVLDEQAQGFSVSSSKITITHPGTYAITSRFAGADLGVVTHTGSGSVTGLIEETVLASGDANTMAYAVFEIPPGSSTAGDVQLTLSASTSITGGQVYVTMAPYNSLG